MSTQSVPHLLAISAGPVIPARQMQEVQPNEPLGSIGVSGRATGIKTRRLLVRRCHARLSHSDVRLHVAHFACDSIVLLKPRFSSKPIEASDFQGGQLT